ncbi:MAG: porin family protein [Alphaproteobacteria bacterium]|nr:porin family protein [Alphaproteobacteria bacterium]
MHSRKLWLATTAVAALATAQQAQADGMYVSVFGGANFQKDDSHVAGSIPTYFEIHNTDPDTGFVIGGAIGTGLDNWVKGLRVELEASYRRNDVGGDWQDGFTFYGAYTNTGSIDANSSTFAIMANVAYDIEMGWKIKPYVMGGAGWARTKFEGAEFFTGGGTNTSFDVENSGFAWQLGAGFNYEVAPGVDVGLGYRYFDGPNSSYFAGKNIAPIDHDNTNHSVMVNLTIDTN